MTEQQKMLRYNKGKLAYNLIPASATRELAKVLTKGAEKYAPRNWEKGGPWTEVLGCAERHIAAFKSGIDYDHETRLYHLSHAMTNLAFLIEFYETHPEFDDRNHKYLNQKKLGLDIDEVLADWIGHYCKREGIENRPQSWSFHRQMVRKLDELRDDHDFWLSVPRLCDPSDLPIEPTIYITKRPVSVEITEQWLDLHGFPAAKVISLEPGESKLEAVRDSGVDIFVDDNWDTFCELNRNGILCFLMDSCHNRKSGHDVGHKRISSLKELPI